jgi:hypothetical protein
MFTVSFLLLIFTTYFFSIFYIILYENLIESENLLCVTKITHKIFMFFFSFNDRSFAEVIANGFFPSNFVQTAQALFEYNFQPTFAALSSRLGGVSGSYWASYKSVMNFFFFPQFF